MQGHSLTNDRLKNQGLGREGPRSEKLDSRRYMEAMCGILTPELAVSEEGVGSVYELRAHMAQLPPPQY